jgi:hypothetical protein
MSYIWLKVGGEGSKVGYIKLINLEYSSIIYVIAEETPQNHIHGKITMHVRF